MCTMFQRSFTATRIDGSALVCTKCLTECIAASGIVNCPFAQTMICHMSDQHQIQYSSAAIRCYKTLRIRHCAGCNRDIRSGNYEVHECVTSLTPEEERQAAELLIWRKERSSKL